MGYVSYGGNGHQGAGAMDAKGHPGAEVGASTWPWMRNLARPALTSTLRCIRTPQLISLKDILAEVHGNRTHPPPSSDGTPDLKSGGPTSEPGTSAGLTRG